MKRLTEKRNGRNSITLPLDGTIDWSFSPGVRSSNIPAHLEGEPADRLAAYEETGLTPAQIKYILPRQSAEEAVERMKTERERYDEWFAWKQAEQEGRLLVLPRKSGDEMKETM